MKISVVIPVYNEEKRIKQSIHAIYANTVQPYEIILSDGGSSDRTVEIVSEAFPDVIIVDNPQRNAAAGRNVGIARATGEIIAFTDGDCIVDKCWVENIRTAFERQRIDGVGGKVLNAEPENRYEEYWGNLAWNLIMSFPSEPYQVKEKTLNDAFVTCNCAYTKKLLNELGCFDTFFANNAEDVDLCWRALNAGAELIYDPSIRIYAHNVTTLGGIIKKSFRNGISSSKLQKVYGTRVNIDPNIYKMLIHNIGGFIKRETNAGLNCTELFFHLMGKYCGSIKFGVINL